MMQKQNQQTPKKIIPTPLMLLLVAGAFLFLFFNTTHIQHSQKSFVHPKTIEVAMVNKSLPATTVITFSYINTEKVSRYELPPGKLVSPTKAIGRVLTKPVVRGQILTESCLIPNRRGIRPIGDMENMELFYLPLSKNSPVHKSLYSGCIVDVLVDSKTILRGIPLISKAVISSGVDGEKRSPKHGLRRGIILGLLVDTNQAEYLSSAIKKGEITISLSES